MADTARRFGGADDTPAAGNSGAISHPQDVGVGAVLAVGQYKMVGANPIVATKDQKSAGTNAWQQPRSASLLALAGTHYRIA